MIMNRGNAKHSKHTGLCGLGPGQTWTYALGLDTHTARTARRH